MYLNKQQLMGFLGKDPELKTTNNGTKVCQVSIATKETWTDAQGQKQENTEWHTLVFWGKNAENMAQFAHKGSHLYVEGVTKHEKYTDKNNIEKYATKVNVTFWKMLDKRGDSNGGGQAQANVPPAARGEKSNYNPADDAPPSSGGGSSYDDDIPF